MSTSQPRLALAVLSCLLLQHGAAAADAPKPIALLVAVGDQLSLVRQRPSTGSHLEPFERRVLPIKGQTLNLAMLRGLDRALAIEEPQTPRVLLRWEAPAETRQAMAQAHGPERDDLMLQALIAHLRALPERAQWSRIEALLPKYFRHQIGGMGSKLAGIGIYTQPLESAQIDLGDDGVAAVVEGPTEGYNRTINPRTGEHGRATTYVAPYVYFERVTLDAKTLAVTARKSQFDNTKYHDPLATAQDVFQHLPLQDLLGRLMQMAERSAYQSVRGKDNSVEVSTPVELPASASAR